MPGRVGDSPLIGAGSYVDNDVGAATATGTGEQIIKFAGCYQVVEFMRQGIPPKEACNLVLNLMIAKGYRVWVAFAALNKEGEFAAVGMSSFNYHVFSGGTSQELLSSGQYRVPIPTAAQSGEEKALPPAYQLSQNAPNPFNAATSITYRLARAGRVSLRVYDSRGRTVKTLVDGRKPAGLYHIQWDATDGNGRGVASGAYFYQLRAGGFNTSRKMTLVR